MKLKPVEVELPSKKHIIAILDEETGELYQLIPLDIDHPYDPFALEDDLK